MEEVTSALAAVKQATRQAENQGPTSAHVLRLSHYLSALSLAPTVTIKMAVLLLYRDLVAVVAALLQPRLTTCKTTLAQLPWLLHHGTGHHYYDTAAGQAHLSRPPAHRTRPAAALLVLLLAPPWPQAAVGRDRDGAGTSSRLTPLPALALLLCLAPDCTHGRPLD